MNVIVETSTDEHTAEPPARIETLPSDKYTMRHNKLFELTQLSGNGSPDRNGSEGSGRIQLIFARVGCITAVFSAAMFASVNPHLDAQPVPIPVLGTPGYQATDFNPYFNSARGSKTQSNWETLVDQARIFLGAQWEAQADAAIDAQMAAVGQSDYFNTPAEYQAYLRRELNLQKQTAFAAWEITADAQIELERVNFITALTDADKAKAIEESDSAIDQSQSSSTDVSEDKKKWEQAFTSDVSKGLFDFQTAMADLDEDYAAFMTEIASKEQQFEQQRLANEARETVVRQAIAQAATGMQTFLNNNSLFYTETCDGQNNCSYTPEGGALQQLIDDLRDGLNNNTPLSTLATSMNNYLTQKLTDAQGRKAHWDARIRGTNYQPGDTTHVNMFGHSAVRWNQHWLWKWRPNDMPAYIQDKNANNNPSFVDWGAVAGNTPLQSVLDFRNGSDVRAKSYLKGRFLHSAVQITAIHSMDFCGNSQGTNGSPFDGYCYSSHGTAAFAFADIGTHKGHLSTNINSELDYSIRTNFDWYDPNADNNATVWAGYVNDLTPVTNNWTNNILPAIQNWEAQVTTYNADLTAWKAQANTNRAQATTEYNRRLSEMTAGRNKWLSQMQEEFRNGQSQWQVLASQNTADTANGGSGATTTAVAGVTASVTQPDLFRDAFLSQQNKDFLKHQISVVPDSSVIDNLAREITRTAQGLQQTALAGTMSDYARQQQEDIINTMVGNLESVQGISTGEENNRDLEGFNVTVAANGTIRATRQIHSGQATRTGGNGTSMSDYAAELEQQSVEIAPPPVLKLVSGGGLFDNAWNLNDVYTDFGSNSQKYGSAVQESYANFGQSFENAQNEMAQNMQQFYEDREGQIKEAKLAESRKKNGIGSALQSIAMSMMGGLDFGGAAQEYMNNQVAGAAAEAIGIPANFFTGILNGESWQSSLTSATEYLVTDYVTKAVVEATGLPAGFVAGIAGPGGLDMSGEGMKAAFQNYSEELFVEKLEEQTGIPGLGALALANHRAHQAERERVDSERKAVAGMLVGGPVGWTVAAAHVMKHTPVGREVTNQALGYLNGSTLGNATGLPSAAFSPLGAILPANVDELDGMASDVESIASGEMDGRELGDKFQDKWDGWVDENKNAAEELGKLTLADLPAKVGDGITGYLSAGMGMVMKPLTTLTNPADDFTAEELVVRESLATQVAEATGQNQAYLMAVARGESYKDAAYAQAYDDAATAIYGENIPPQFRNQVVGSVRDYTENTLERLEFQRQRARAQKDPWNIWRNAEYGSDDQRMALRAVEVGAAVGITVATSGAAGPAAMAFMAGTAGTVITAGYVGYMAAKEGYTAYLRTGDREAGYAGVVSGAANGALGYFTGGQANVSLTYSPEDGFGGSFGYGMNEGGFTAGGSVSWQEGEGITGVGLNAGFTVTDEESEHKGLGVGGSLNFGPDGTFQGGSLSGTFKSDQKEQENGGASSWNGSLGLNFGGDLTVIGATANASTSSENGNDDTGTKTAYNLGGGLTFNRDGTSSIDITNAVSLSDSHEYGFNGAGANVTNTINFSPNGTYIDASQNISIDIKSQSKADAAKAIKGAKARQKARQTELEAQKANATGAELAAIETELAQIEASIGRLEILHRQADLKYARLMRAIAKLEAKGKKEEADRLEANPSLLDDDDYRDEIFEGGEGELANEGDDESYGNAFTQWLGGVGGAIAGLFGHNSDGHGWVDDKGNYHERTCFVAGTLVRVHPDARGAFEQDGSWYKRIEEIEAGDQVLSWNEDSGEISYNSVPHTFIRDTDLIYEITYANGTRVETTWNHPFYIDVRGWVQGKDLRVDDVSVAVTSANDGRRLALTGTRDAKHTPVGITANVSPHRIARIVKSARDELVYNFEVAEDHTYFVTSADVLVHNDALKYKLRFHSNRERTKDILREMEADLKDVENASLGLDIGTIADTTKLLDMLLNDTGLSAASKSKLLKLLGKGAGRFATPLSIWDRLDEAKDVFQIAYNKYPRGGELEKNSIADIVEQDRILLGTALVSIEEELVELNGASNLSRDDEIRREMISKEKQRLSLIFESAGKMSADASTRWKSADDIRKQFDNYLLLRPKYLASPMKYEQKQALELANYHRYKNIDDGLGILYDQGRLYRRNAVRAASNKFRGGSFTDYKEKYLNARKMRVAKFDYKKYLRELKESRKIAAHEKWQAEEIERLKSQGGGTNQHKYDPNDPHTNQERQP